MIVRPLAAIRFSTWITESAVKDNVMLIDVLDITVLYHSLARSHRRATTDCVPIYLLARQDHWLVRLGADTLAQ